MDLDRAGEGGGSPAGKPGPEQQRREETLRAGGLRRRALIDAAVIVGIAILVSAPAANVVDSLMIGVVAISIGMLLFVIRRGNDLTALARAGRWREDAVAGQGLTLEEWRRGAPVAPWAERRKAQKF